MDKEPLSVRAMVAVMKCFNPCFNGFMDKESEGAKTDAR